MKKIVLALFLTLLLGTVAHSASLYILFDPACMDRLEYVALNGNDKSEYVVYHVNTSPGVKIVLEVGAESTTPQDFPPAQVIRCNNAVFDEKLVNAINSNIERVFMVVKKGNDRYYISPITFAARYLRANDYLLYDSPKYRFQFDTRLGAGNENIAYKSPNTEVFFEGVLQNECSGTFLFLQKAEFAGNPHTNIELIPEVGIIEVRSGINAADALRNVQRLEKVNGKKLDRYLRQLCQGIEEPEASEMAAQPAPQEFLTAEPRIIEDAGARGGTSVVRTLDPPAAAAGSATEYHTVKKGETLYRLSKQYNVSVDQLKNWNNKGNSNTIVVGEKLRVSPLAAARRTAPPEGQAQILGGPLGNENTGRAPTSAEMVQRPSNTIYPRGSADGQGENYHIVRPGETIASIAMKYGYTEQRFREFNNLRGNDVAVIGKALKTSDCDCPPSQQAAPAVTNSNWPNMGGQNTTASYNTTQPRVTTRYYQPGFTQRQADNYSPRGQANTTTDSPEENFYNDDLGSNKGQEFENLNTPLFLDRPGASPSTYTPPAAARPAAPAPSQGREYSPEGDFYSITGNRIDNTGRSGSGVTNGNRSGTGLISGSISSRTPLRNNSVPEYGYYGDTRSTNKTTEDRRFYIVKEGDTLFRIARMYSITVERLRDINNLGANEVIIPNQKIYLN